MYVLYIVLLVCTCIHCKFYLLIARTKFSDFSDDGVNAKNSTRTYKIFICTWALLRVKERKKKEQNWPLRGFEPAHFAKC